MRPQMQKNVALIMFWLWALVLALSLAARMPA